MIRSFRHSLALAAASMLAAAAPAEAILVFEVNGSTVIAQTAETTQQVGADGQTTHDIEVDVKVGAALKILNILSEHLSTGATASTLSVTLRNITTTGTLTEERVYGNVTVKAIQIAELDGRSKDQLTAEVRLSARTMSLSQGGSVSSKISAKAKAITAGQFRLSIENLPNARILRLNSHRFLPCASDVCDSVDRIDFVLRGETDIATWRRWFQKASAEPTITTYGKYEILDIDMSTPLARVDFDGLRPVSFTESSDAIGPTARVVLRGGRVRLGF